MEDTFPTELWQAGHAWVSGRYVKTPLDTVEDVHRAVAAGKNFWIPSDGKWAISCGGVIGVLFFVFLLVIGLWMAAGITVGWIAWVGFLIMIIILLGIGVFIWRPLINRTFLAIGPRGFLYRRFFTIQAFRWSDLSDVDLVRVRRQEDEDGQIIPAHYKNEIQCKSCSGTTVTVTNSGLSRDEVKSPDIFTNLFLAYWHQVNLIKFRDAEIIQAEANAIVELEVFTRKKFSPGTPVEYTTIGGHVTSVSMVGCGIMVLPVAIGQFSSLLALNLENNQLSTLPNAMGQLGLLTDLNLKHNPLSSLPASITLLKSLRRFSIDEAVIPSLLAEVKQWLMELNGRGCLNPA